MTDKMQKALKHIEKEKLIKADIASIENRVRHAFNQGYDLGFKNGKEKAKPQEQEPRWISVSDRLPEDHKDVLAYLSSDRISICRYNSHKLPFSNNPIGWGYVPGIGFIDFEKENVIAWMSLPKAYREG